MALEINSYQFGQVVINGRGYTSDVIVFPDRVRDNWYRKTGHELSLEDVAEVVAESPEVFVVGTGASGLVKVLPGVEQRLEADGIELFVQPTDMACRTYNSLGHSRRVVAALHLTC